MLLYEIDLAGSIPTVVVYKDRCVPGEYILGVHAGVRRMSCVPTRGSWPRINATSNTSWATECNHARYRGPVAAAETFPSLSPASLDQTERRTPRAGAHGRVLTHGPGCDGYLT